MAAKLPFHRCIGYSSRPLRNPLVVPSRAGHSCRPSVTVSGGIGDFFSGFLDGSWAPKSTRIWRQQSFEYSPNDGPGLVDSPAEAGGSEAAGSEEATDRPIEDLQARINNVPSSSRPSLGDQDDVIAADVSASITADSSGFDGSSPLRRSFSEADDGDLAAALNRRIGQIAATTASYDSEVTEEEMRQPLTAQELRELIYTKYGKTYDVSFVRRDIPGKTFVCLNIMWNHLEQRSFKLTEQQYMEKLEGVTFLVGALGQTDKVRAFLREPARSQKGLPARPVVGTAISIRFDLEPGVIEEWFGNGYQ